ncbi:MAG: response regulator [Steroidobacteraceae bacterium]|jgi:CheY-like chemotaxis protein
MQPGTLTLLLVEDDDVDAETIVRCVASAKIANPLLRARDGIEALEMLRGTNGKQKVPAPVMLLVDIRMPRLDGIGLIKAVRADPALTRTVIFVLTTSDSDRDRMAAYDAHVAGYIVKSNAQDEIFSLTKMLEYYLLIVVAPPADVT